MDQLGGNMAAASTDKFRKLSRRWVGQIGSGGVADASTTTVPLASATNLATDTGVTVVIDRVDANGTATPSLEETVVGVVSGSNLVSCTRGVEGTAQAHSAGAVVEVLVTSDGYNDIIDGILVNHGQDGLHSSTDFNGTEVIIDADADTSMTADTDDQIDFKLGGSDRFRLKTADLDIVTSTGNIQVAGADPKRAMYVPAVGMYPSTTAPCASLTQVESSTNDVNIKVLDFDGAGTSKEYAEFGIQSPSYWDASTVTAQFVWYASAGSGTVNWEIQGLALSDDDALDTAYGTLQEVTDTLLATGDVHITAETSAITIAGTPVAGDWLQFKVARDPANDTNTSDARLMGVKIKFGIAQFNDA